MLEVLIVDDQPAVRTALRVLFEIHNLPCQTADGPEAALSLVRRHRFGVVVQDMNFTEDTTSGVEGVRLFRAIKQLDPDLPVLLITAWTALDTAVQLVKAGASDYISKPWDDQKLLDSVQTLLRLRQGRLDALSAHTALEGRDALAARHDLCGLVYQSARMHAVAELAVRVAAADVPVLVTGPNGAGKEKIADLIHANSRRHRRPLVKVNAGALPEALVESELFGAEAGAYTGAVKRRQGRFEAADTGTLFLDEIGNLSLAGQMKLLRVLQTGEFERVGSSATQRVDVRVISATNVNLEAAIADGRFREDLYFRLNVIEVAVPPLRERPEDVLPLARHFLERFGPVEHPLVLSEAASDALRQHPWPGNIRQLQNTMQRAALLTQGEQISVEDLGLFRPSGPSIARSAPQPGLAPIPTPSVSAPRAATEPATLDVADQDEREQVEAALLRHDFVVARAAQDLGLTRQALYRRMERLGLSVERRVKGR